jgi:hypothetical protein
MENGMRAVVVLIAVLALAGCNEQAGKHREAKATGWRDGGAVSADGARFSIVCVYGEWSLGLKTIERLVPPDSERQWVNRDVFYKFGNEPEQRTKGTLNENRLDLNQAEEGSTVSLNYGQDVAAGLMRGNHKTLTIRTTDGADRPKQWSFDIEGSRGNIPNDAMGGCPAVGQPDTGNLGEG